jgi:hypothetical protein
LALDPTLEPVLTDEQRSMLQGVADVLGVNALSRMLGLWLEQESLLRESSNRELALEVASLRLARWPAVQRIEKMLAGGKKVAVPPSNSAPSSPSPSQPPGQPPPAQPPVSPSQGECSQTATLGDRLSQALWHDRERQLAGAIEHANVSADGPILLVRFGAATSALAQYSTSEAIHSRLEAAAKRVFPQVREVRVEVEGSPSVDDALDGSLQDEADKDPQVALARRIVGGEIVSVRPDRGSP